MLILLGCLGVASACGGQSDGARACAGRHPDSIPEPPFGFTSCTSANEGASVCTTGGAGWSCNGGCWSPFWDGPCWPLGLDDAGTDGAPYDVTTATCAQLSARFDEVASTVDVHCDTPADCMFVGGTGTCECAPSLGSSASGIAIAKAELSTAPSVELEALRSNFMARCWNDQAQCIGISGGCVCDAAPVTLGCVDHVCTGTWASCLHPLDAGP